MKRKFFFVLALVLALSLCAMPALAEESLFIDDNAKNIETAKRFGIKSPITR